MTYNTNILRGIPGEDGLTSEEIRSRENMERLGREYSESADRLKERVDQLKSRLDVMPLEERKRAELRIALLEQEIRETRRTGAEAGGFYKPGHRFLPRQNRSAVWPGAYLC